MILRVLRESPVIYLEFQRAPYTQTVERRDTQFFFQYLAVVMVPINKSCTLLWRCLVSAKLLSVAIHSSCGYHTTRARRLETYFEQVTGSNLGGQTDYPDWSPLFPFWSCKQKPQQYLHARSSYYLHDLCDCEAIAQLRFRHLGHFFREPSDFYDAPISKVLHFIRSLGLIKG
jgi:hypothetical protein